MIARQNRSQEYKVILNKLTRDGGGTVVAGGHNKLSAISLMHTVGHNKLIEVNLRHIWKPQQNSKQNKFHFLVKYPFKWFYLW